MGKFSSLAEQKALLRKELAGKSALLDPNERALRSQKILAKLLANPRFSKAHVLLSYVARPPEVETRLLLEEALRRKKKLFVPRLDSVAQKIDMIELRDLSDLRPGSYGILEPKKPEPMKSDAFGFLDCVLVPGLAFDRAGHRLGRGKGYYDRFLSTLPSRVVRYGLAYDIQMFDQIPTTPMDVKVDKVFFNG